MLLSRNCICSVFEHINDSMVSIVYAYTIFLKVFLEFVQRTDQTLSVESHFRNF